MLKIKFYLLLNILFNTFNAYKKLPQVIPPTSDRTLFRNKNRKNTISSKNAIRVTANVTSVHAALDPTFSLSKAHISPPIAASVAASTAIENFRRLSCTLCACRSGVTPPHRLQAHDLVIAELAASAVLLLRRLAQEHRPGQHHRNGAEGREKDDRYDRDANHVDRKLDLAGVLVAQRLLERHRCQCRLCIALFVVFIRAVYVYSL